MIKMDSVTQSDQGGSHVGGEIVSLVAFWSLKKDLHTSELLSHSNPSLVTGAKYMKNEL